VILNVILVRDVNSCKSLLKFWPWIDGSSFISVKKVDPKWSTSPGKGGVSGTRMVKRVSWAFWLTTQVCLCQLFGYKKLKDRPRYPYESLGTFRIQLFSLTFMGVFELKMLFFSDKMTIKHVWTEVFGPMRAPWNRPITPDHRKGYAPDSKLKLRI